MVKQAFRGMNLRQQSLNLIVQCNRIIAEYLAAGYTMTLRQLYYQLVSRDIVPNTEKSYDKVGTVVSNGRLAGLIDWAAIEDRGRQPHGWAEFDNARDFIEAYAGGFRLRRWAEQSKYVELWVEKEALAGVLSPLASRYHVTLMVNKGYSSSSAMHQSAERIIREGESKTERHVLYLGDHDPSGEDMVRDIRDRLEMFGADVEVEKVALTMPQIRQYKPPPNPAKLTDSRAAEYIRIHGEYSWEVDALPPTVLGDLITTAITQHMDMDAYNAVIEREKVIKTKLRSAAAKL